MAGQTGAPASDKQREDMDVDAVFAKLKTIGGKKR